MWSWLSVSYPKDKYMSTSFYAEGQEEIPFDFRNVKYIFSLYSSVIPSSLIPPDRFLKSWSSWVLSVPPLRTLEIKKEYIKSEPWFLRSYGFYAYPYLLSDFCFTKGVGSLVLFPSDRFVFWKSNIGDMRSVWRLSTNTVEETTVVTVYGVDWYCSPRSVKDPTTVSSGPSLRPASNDESPVIGSGCSSSTSGTTPQTWRKD